MRIQSPKTGTKSGDTCDIEGCALAYKTWIAYVVSRAHGSFRPIKESVAYIICNFNGPRNAIERQYCYWEHSGIQGGSMLTPKVCKSSGYSQIPEYQQFSGHLLVRFLFPPITRKITSHYEIRNSKMGVIFMYTYLFKSCFGSHCSSIQKVISLKSRWGERARRSKDQMRVGNRMEKGCLRTMKIVPTQYPTIGSK